MKKYTVKEIAKLLDVTEEQVRRWIRNKTMKATLKSKKEGYFVNENDLKSFIEEHSKYGKEVTSYIENNYTNYLNIFIADLEANRDNLTLLIETLKSQISKEES